MPGHHAKHLQWRYTPRHGDGMAEFCRQNYGTDAEVLHFYAISTAAQDANVYEVWTIPASYAAIGAKAYKRVGVVYIPPSDMIGWAYVFKNYEDTLDYYYQKFEAFDSADFVHFTIAADDIDLWFTTVKVYVGIKTIEDWRRPYRPPTPNCYGRLEDAICQWRQWAMY